jgi:predicted Rossmann-fold nucleotide-binding protein
MIKLKQLACVALAVSLTGCGTLFQQNKAQPGEPSEGSHSELLQCPRSVPPNGFRSFIDAKPQALSLAKVPDPRCTSAIPNASYTGPYKGADDLLLSADLERDLYCASWFKAAKYPNGFIGIYGSSRITEANQQADARVKQANDKVYQEVKAFAEQWTRQYGKQLPVLTGAGGGLMEAAARGAMAAGGPSIGYTTYYGKAREGGGKPDLAFWTYGTQADGSKAPLITDGLILSSVGIREYAMFLHSLAIVIAPGGTGTEWEIFQILESIKSQQLSPVPVYLLGSQNDWQSLFDRLADMAKRGTVKPCEVEQHFVLVGSASELMAHLKADLRLP